MKSAREWRDILVILAIGILALKDSNFTQLEMLDWVLIAVMVALVATGVWATVKRRSAHDA